MISMDEMRIFMTKLAYQGSTLGPLACSLWSKDEASSPTKNGMCEIYARINILGAIACDGPDEFSDLFAAETMNGLYTRMIICPGPSGWKWDFDWEPTTECRKPGVVDVPSSATKARAAWIEAGTDSQKKMRGRLGEIAMRVALISASANHDTTITEECMQAALRFAEWQELVKMVYCASPAQNDDAKITVAILAALKEEGGEMVRFRDLARKHNWARKFGSPAVTRVKWSLIKEELIHAELRIDPETDNPIPGEYTGRVCCNE
jgi:hypothetical protein